MASKSLAVKKPVKKTVATAKLHAKVRRHAKKVLVPHKENQFRPHLIRAQGIIAVLVVALITQVSYSFVSTGHVSVLGRVSDINTAELLSDTNKQRSMEGLSSLSINDKLNQAAYLKAQNMLTEQYWEHVSPSGIQPWKWFNDAGYNYSFAGENLAKNYPSAAATVDAWMNSPKHRENIMKKDYTNVGFAVVNGILNQEDTTLVVALYGAPATTEVIQAASENVNGSSFAAPAVSTGLQTPLANFGSALEALSPVTIVILGLLGIVAIVGVAAHHYRHQLPKPIKKTWRLHQGLYTFVGMITLGVLIIIATGGGNI